MPVAGGFRSESAHLGRIMGRRHERPTGIRGSTLTDPRARQLAAAGDSATPADELAALVTSADADILTALVANPSTPTRALRQLARTPRIGVRKALLDSPRCPLVSSVAEDRLAYEGVDLGLFVDEESRRRVCRSLIGTAHRAEVALLFSDPSFRILDNLRTLHSLFTIHGGKKRERKLNRHDYLRFLTGFNARGGQQAVLDLPFITLLGAIRLLGQERLVQVMTTDSPARAARCLRLLEAVTGNPAGEESARDRRLLEKWLAREVERDAAWPTRLHDYLARKRRRRALHHRRRPPRVLRQAEFAKVIGVFNRAQAGRGLRVHLPRTETELQALAATMAHCIGSDHYVEHAVDGLHFLLHAHPPGNRRRGVTCQFDAKGRLLQARGFANGEACVEGVRCAEDAMVAILEAGKRAGHAEEGGGA